MAKVINLETPFILKPYSKKELRMMMNLSDYVFTKWLKRLQPDLGKPIGKLYSIRQVQIIIHAYGVPGQIVNEAA